MKNSLLLTIISLLISSQIFAQNVIYAARITDNKNKTQLVTNLKASYGTTYLRFKKGDTDLKISFNKIRQIEISGEPFSIGNGKFIASNVLFTSGTRDKLLLNLKHRQSRAVVNSYFEGINPDYGADYKALIKNLSYIEFLHNGTFKKCPLCNTIYYNTSAIECHFDKSILVDP